jgi:tetratricopeptide (TPR) repeat protein
MPFPGIVGSGLKGESMARAARQLERCKATLAVGLCTALLIAPLPLGAQTDDENARIHFESGAAYLKQSDNESALREFQAAYALSKRPALLLNIANVYERMGKPREAVDALTKYLEEDPKTPDRTTVETRITNLKKRVDALPASPPPSASSSVAPPASAAPLAPVPSSPPPEAPRSAAAPNRVPAYIAFGVGGAAAIGAVATGLAAKAKFDKADTTCKPNCSDDTVNPIKSLALVSDVLTGVAVIGVGVGAILLFTAKPARSEAARGPKPSLRAGVGPSGGKLEATWRF